MGLLDMLKNLFTGRKFDNLIKIYLQDKKCGQKIRIVLRKSYDIQRVYDENQDAVYQVNKVIICDNCFNKIEIEIKFDKRYSIISQEIDGGEYITEEEYNG